MRGAQQNYIFPFLWEHGEPHDVLKREIEKVAESHIGALCVEARPHPDFAGDQWWSDMDLILREAKSRGLEVWVLDDDHFPTGHAAGAFQGGKHPLSNLFLTCYSTDVAGPFPRGAVPLAGIMPPDGVRIAVVSCPRVSPDSTQVDVTQAVDLTGMVKNGWLRWDVPDGLWRIFTIYTTHMGDGKRDYFNMLDTASVRMLIDHVYEPHFAHYRSYFGNTLRGFFSDEPQFGNQPGWDFQSALGVRMDFIPWSGELEERMRSRWGESFATCLPALWYDAGEETGKIRYAYMDEVTKQLKVSFADQISRWCEAHGVTHIGHIIEDDNAHGRLGCSTGHFFRSLSGMGMSGIDVVLLQIMPKMDQQYHQWVAGDRDGEFFYHGLARLGSSLAHVDAKKHGDTMCEIFGAFGWQEGVSLMKWLADHMLSRGVNHFVPHAFSPKAFPDPDHPPHFYAGGNHPQFPCFAGLMDYMNRLCHLITGGKALSQAAVLYHAESEWAGSAMLFQKPVRQLTERQIDCDIVPSDLFSPENPYGMSFDGKVIRVSDQAYQILILPECDYLPAHTARFAVQAAEQGFPVILVNRPPRALCEDCAGEEAVVQALSRCEAVPLADLANAVSARVAPRIVSCGPEPTLRTYCYQADCGLVVLCFNETTERTVNTSLLVRCEATAAARYDAMKNQLYRLPAARQEEGISVPVRLEAGEACALILSGALPQAPAYVPYPLSGEMLPGPWRLFWSDVASQNFVFLREIAAGAALPDLTDWAAEHRFCGTLRYETAILSSCDQTRVLRLPPSVDVARVLVNGQAAGTCVGAPYCVEIPLRKGDNMVAVEVMTTPVYRVPDHHSGMTVLPPLGMTDPPMLL